jgi:hypothetical protein
MTFTFEDMKKLIKKLIKIPEISGKNIFSIFFKIPTYYNFTIMYSKFYYSIVSAILTIE